MSVINKGTSFSNGEQLTAKKINDMLDLAEFNQSATDSASTTVNSASQIIVRDSGITTAKLATDAVETAKIKDANVTLPKIATQVDQTVIGNVSGADASPVAVPIVGADGILVDDDALGTSDTQGATQGNIKAYVDAATSGSTYDGGQSITLPSGLIMKFGSVTASISGTSVSFGEEFTNGVVSALACPNNGATLTQSSGYSGKAAVDSLTTSGMNVSCDGSAYWQAFGY